MMQTFFLRKTATVPLIAAAFLWLATSAHAVQFGFDNITNNNATNATTGEAQLFADVTATGNASQALFTFSNTGPLASSITDVYFDDQSPLILLSIASITGGSGVAFSQGASPGDLPGGNSASPDFHTTLGFSADSNPPVQPNGVNPGETLGILFNLQAGGIFQNVLDELQSGTLRVGIHVQGFANGGSESFVNTPGNGGGVNPVPEPSTMLLLGSGLVALGWWGKKRLPTTNRGVAETISA